MARLKPGWHQAEVKDLASFITVIEIKWREWAEIDEEVREPWFRGHAKESWSLVPGVYRPPYSLVDEDSYRHEFQLRAYPFLSEATYQPSSDWDWYFLMQHHGLPTRLLDWTESALVSLYFAVERRTPNAPGAVWILDPWWLNARIAEIGELVGGCYHPSIQRYIWPVWGNRDQLPNMPAAFEPPHNSKRLAAQRGKFTVHGSSRASLEACESLKPRLVKIVIPASAKDKIRRQLAMAGITEGVIFPDLGGLSREVKEAWSYEVDID
jgi:FRG domain